MSCSAVGRRGRDGPRGRRAAALVLSVLLALPAVLAGADAATAANTASELRVDRVGDVSDAEDGVRPFAGSSRYETAVLLAERYARQRGGLGSISTAVLVSGESLADGMVAAGLAGQEQAAVLLTRRDVLPDAVADFLDRHDVSTVIAVGGAGSISDEVLAEAAAAAGTPAVRRVEGEDRYGTAAAAAALIDSNGSWCGAEGAVALLVNSSDERLAELAGLAPLAFARTLPILLTTGDVLPDAAAEYLRQHRIDRVVIVGSTAHVSDALISPLLATGVDEVLRVVSGAAAVSGAAVAQLMTVTCEHELGPSQTLVAVAGRSAAIDAVAAAPLLGIGLDDTGPVPLLMVDNQQVLLGAVLPPSTRSFLARLPEEIDDRKNHALIVAIGGPQAVPDSTVQAAVAAAASARPLTARITATAGDAEMRISFSESLEVDVPSFRGRLRDALWVNDFPAWVSDVEVIPSVAAGPCEMFSALEVTLRDEQRLEAGDVIRLDGIAGWHADNDDRREIRGASYSVPAPRPSLRAPAIEIIALPGQTELWLSVQADEFLESEPDGGITVNPSRIRVDAHDDTPVTIGQPTAGRIDRFLGTQLRSFPLQAPGAGSYALASGDLVVVRSGAATNADEQRSPTRRAVVRQSDPRLAITAVRAGPPNPGVDDSARTARPDEIADVSRRAQASLGETLSVVGKWSGSAAGAAGNGWKIFSSRSDRTFGTAVTPGSDPPATQVWVDPSQRTVTIRHINAPAGTAREQTYGELVQILNGNQAFSRHFSAELSDPCEDDVKIVDLDEPDFTGTFDLEGGKSSVSFLVAFNDYVQRYLDDSGADDENASALIGDILGGLLPEDADRTADLIEIAAPRPGKELIFRFTTENPEHTIGQTINIRSKRIVIGEAAAASYREDDPDTPDVDESTSAGRALFAVASRDSRLLTDLPRSDSTSP